MRGTYIGPLQHLQGKTAMLREPPEEGYVMAQFDDMLVTRSGNPLPNFLPNHDALGFGWHVFKRNDFEVEE